MKRSTTCLIILFGALCGLLALGVWGFNVVTTEAETVFGSAATSLNPSQKFLLSWQLLGAAESLTSPADPFASEVNFKIELGESPTSVANRLMEAGIIQDAANFRNFLIYSGIDTQIQAGEYHLSPATPAIQIAYTLLDATPSEVPFAVLAGWRLEEVAASLPNSGLSITPDLFLAEARRHGLEGYLLPGVYIVPRTISVQALLERLTKAFGEAVTPEMREGFANQGLSLDEAVILASIVEREAVIDNERPLITSVFLNRLAIDMKLEADPTVQYALGYNNTQNTWWTNPLSAANLHFNSPYNTYQYEGLPPGPICNPSVDALRAVAFPAQTPYYYFRATCDDSGQHNFAETYQEHVENGCP